MNTEKYFYTPDRYRKIIRENDYDEINFQPINFSLLTMSSEQISTKWLCHQEADFFANELNNGRPGIVCTGVGLSGTPHVGTLSQIIRAIELQKNGIPVQIVLGDVDAHLGKRRDGKIISLTETAELAERYRSFVLALGFKDEKPSILRSQLDYMEVMRTAMLLTPYTSHQLFQKAEEDLHDVYATKGRVDPDMSPSRMTALLLMTADFLHNSLALGIPNVLVSLGVDEHQYVRFGQELLRNLQAHGSADQNFRLSGIYTKMTRGLNGAPKMSKSIPGSAITGDMTPDEIYRHVMNGDVEYANPEESVVFQMIEATTLYDKQTMLRTVEYASQRGSEWQSVKEEFAHYLSELFARWPR